MSAIVAPTGWSYGRLVNNWQIVDMLGKALSQGEHVGSTVPNLLGELLRSGGWRQWTNPHTGVEQTWRPHEFRRFIEADRPEGLGSKVDKMIAYLAETPVESIDFHNALNGTPGGNNNPDGVNQHSEVNNSNSVIDQDVDEIESVPFAPKLSETAKQSSRASQKTRDIARLRRESPELLDDVGAGRLTLHGAMVKAGFRPKTITVPEDPVQAARRLALHFRDDDLAVLIETLKRFQEQPPQRTKGGRPKKARVAS